ncbi:insulin degrading metalloproteinase isoform X2 [Calliopsis andreniformis]
MPVHSYIEKQYNDIVKSSNDKQFYRGLLLSNKMKVLLISDPETDKSAASLDVNVGFLNDPDDLPGLAHFCEHMLFLGTQKYPQENEYNMYLSQNSGSFNAVTHVDHTTYFFDVHPEKLEGALDRFAQFFIAPLFTEALTELELNAIHLEHEKNTVIDTWRLDQLEKSSADPKHPFSKFGTGNRETLEIIPKQKGINVREELIKFYETFYSSNLMSLCVLGKESLDELEKIVVELFSQVKNKDVDLPIWPYHPFKEEHFKTKWYVVPIKDIRSLNIVFPLPDLQAFYKSSPAYYVSYLLGHEGKGSLLSALKAKGWCNSLVSGNQSGARGFSFFNVIVDLTEEGIQHVDDIVLLIFQYINMLKKHGPVEWIYNEYADIADMNFRFKEKSSPSNYVSYLVQKVQCYPMEDVLIAENLYLSWEPDLINWVISQLIPDNIRINVIGKLFEDIANETEKWYGTKYKKEKIPENIINMWCNAGYSSDLKLPEKNEFIPEKFDIKSAENITKFPTIIEDTPLLRLWFKQDDEFLVPKVNLSIEFVSPLAYMDPVNANLNYIFVQLFRDALNEYTYAANLAGLRWEVGNSVYGITIGISGYDNKQHVLLNKTLDKLVTFQIDSKRFEIFKESYIRNVKNFAAEQPYKLTVYYLTVLLSEQIWTKEELLAATSYVTVERLEQYISQFLSKIHMECLIHGNMTMTEAIEVAKLIESKLTSANPHIIPLLPSQLILYREIRLEDGCQFLFEVENKLHKSSCTDVYYQTGLRSTESNMLLELLAQIISEPCFSTLRTKEQLGYIVSSGIRKTSGTHGIRIIVQSDRHPEYVEKRINAFLDSMVKHITCMTDEQFNRHKESLAARRLEKPKTLTTLSAIFWGEISSQQYNFDRVNIEVAYLRSITQLQILEFYKEMIESDKQHKLSVHIVSTVKDGESVEKNSAKVDENIESCDVENVIKHKKIDDIISFRLSQSLYPLLKPFNDIPRKGAHSSKL